MVLGSPITPTQFIRVSTLATHRVSSMHSIQMDLVVHSEITVGLLVNLVSFTYHLVRSFGYKDMRRAGSNMARRNLYSLFYAVFGHRYRYNW